jgi:hypothetical protein
MPLKLGKKKYEKFSDASAGTRTKKTTKRKTKNNSTICYILADSSCCCHYLEYA